MELIQTGPSESMMHCTKTWTLLWGTCTWRVRHADKTILEQYLALKTVGSGLPGSWSTVCGTVKNVKRFQLMNGELLWAMAIVEIERSLARGIEFNKIFPFLCKITIRVRIHEHIVKYSYYA